MVSILLSENPLLLYEAIFKICSRSSCVEAILDKLSSISPIIMILHISWSVILAILRIAFYIDVP